MAKFEVLLAQNVVAIAFATVEAETVEQAEALALENANAGLYTFEIDWDGADDMRTIEHGTNKIGE